MSDPHLSPVANAYATVGTRLDVNEDLYKSARSGDLANVQRILEADSAQLDVNSTSATTHHDTPLHAACEFQNLEIVECLLEAGANIQPDRHGSSPLHIAAKNGCRDIIHALVTKFPDRQSSIRLVDDAGETALTSAVRSGHLDTVKYLLEAEAAMLQWSAGLAQLCEDYPGWAPPAHIACLFRRHEVLRYFIEECGVSVDSKTPAGKEIQCPSSMEVSLGPVKSELTLLYCAIASSKNNRNWVKCIDYLVRKGADISLRSKNRWSAIDVAYKLDRTMALALMALARACSGSFETPEVPKFSIILRGSHVKWYWVQSRNHDLFKIIACMMHHFRTSQQVKILHLSQIVDFFDRHFIEIAGESRHKCAWFREPGCVFKTIPSVGLDSSWLTPSFMSLAMPYFSYIDKNPLEGREANAYGNRTIPDSRLERYSGLQIHATLDEYCHPDLQADILRKRNMDQVLVRYTMNLRNQTKENYDGPFLVVPQAWVWRLDELVISSHREPAGSHAAMAEAMHARGGQGPDKLIGTLLSEWVNRLARREIEIGQPNLFTAFARSIALLSENVNEYLHADKMGNINIETEKIFLHEIEDIREELAMIQTVLFQQEEVWREFAFATWPQYWPNGPEGRFEPRRDSDPAWNIIQRPQDQFPRLKKRLKKLDDDAARVQRSIELKLDLKQKHASLKEARTASVVSASVFGFTIITILFTPLSFVASLFALPIDRLQQSQVPSQGGDSTVYSTWYIGTWMATAEFVSLTVTGLAAWAALEYFMKVEVTRHARTWLSAKLHDIAELVRIEDEEKLPR